MTAPLPVTVIGGYLGAGKTTLINHVLRHSAGRRIAVLVNEFGALSIDADLIEGQSDGVISIAGGCVCCSFGDDLVGALGALAALDPAPDHIVIEASGVAIPGAISASVGLLVGFELAATVVLADTETVQATAADRYLGDTILRQLADADLVFATKGDLVPEAQRAPVLAWLAEAAPRASVIAAVQGQVPVAAVLGPRGGGPLPAPGAHGDTLFDSVVWAPPGPVDPEALARSLAEGPWGLVRAKGFVQDLAGDWHLIQVVGRRFTITKSETAQTPALVLIGPKGALPIDGLS